MNRYFKRIICCLLIVFVAHSSIVLANNSNASSEPSGYFYERGILGGEIYYEQNGHFHIEFPGITGVFSTLYIGEKTGEELLQALESIYSKFLALGYTYHLREKWPMEVTLSAIGGPAEDELAVYSYGWNVVDGNIQLNKSLFHKGQCDMNVLIPLLTHEFFHFVQGNYISNDYHILWFDEATASYYEYEVLGKAPSSLYVEAMLLLEGVFPAKDTAQDGYARVSVIKYLKQRYGDSFILDMYKRIGNGNFEDAYTMVSGGETPRKWVTDFYIQHLSGKLIGNASPISFPELYTNIRRGGSGYDKLGSPVNLVVPDADDIKKLKEDEKPVVLGKVSLNIPAYGARLAPIFIDDKELDKLNDNVALTVKSNNSDTEVTVIALQGSSNIKDIQTGGIILDNFKKNVRDNKYMYLVMVTGLQGIDSVDCEVEVMFADEQLYGFMYHDGPYSTFSEVGLTTALKAAGLIKLDPKGQFKSDVPSATASITRSKGSKTETYEFNIQNFTMSGFWDQASKTGNASFSFNMTLLRTETNKQNTFTGEQTRAFVTTYDYNDTVTGTANLSQNAEGYIVFDVNLRGTRTGRSVMRLHIVYTNGKEYWGDNPTITPINSNYSGKQTYLFTAFEEAD